MFGYSDRLLLFLISVIPLSMFFRCISAADCASEDLELTHMLCESLLVSDVQISPEGEEAAQNACVRLRQAVETLLDLLNHANAQVNHA